MSIVKYLLITVKSLNSTSHHLTAFHNGHFSYFLRLPTINGHFSGFLTVNSKNHIIRPFFSGH